MKKLLLFLLFCGIPAFAQNTRVDVPFPSISSTTTTPYLVANVPPNSPTLQVCLSPANAVPCSNYAQTYDSAGNACPNGAQDTPQPQPSTCQPTGDAEGNLGFWIAPGTYDYTVTIGDQSFGPFTITPGGSGGGGSGSIGGIPVQNPITATPGTGIFVSADGSQFQGQTRAYVDARDCGIPQDHATDALATTNACIQAHPGATILFPKTNSAGISNVDYVFSGTVTLQGSQTKLAGATGSCSPQAANCVVLSFTNNATDGVDVGPGNTCQGCSIENLEIRGPSPTSIVPGFGGTIASNWLPCSPPANQTYAAGVVCVTSGNGIEVETPFVTLEHVIVSRFGKHCIEMNGLTPKLADNFSLIDVSSLGCHGDGIYIHGGDSNAGSTLQYHAYYNLFWGTDDIGFLTNAHYSPQMTSNHAASTTIGSTVPIQGYNCNGSVCTMNTSSTDGIMIGNAVVVAGTSIDGTYFVSSTPSTTQFTFALASSSTGATAGTVRLTSRNEFYAAAGITGGGYYIHSSNVDPVVVNPYIENGQLCDFAANTIILGSINQCVDVNGNITGFRIGNLSGLPGVISQNGLNVDNTTDADINMTLRAGATAIGPRHVYFKFVDNTVATLFRVGQGQISGIDNFFINAGTTDPATSGCFGNCRLHVVALANTDISSQGSSPVRINPDNGSGTGGLAIYGGGSSHPLVGTVDASGNAAFNGQITSSITTGTAPLVVSSTTKVANLNVDQTDGIRLFKFTATLSPSAVAANTCQEQLFTVTGIVAGDFVFVNKPTAQAGLGVSGARASGANQVGLNYCNNTASPITPTASEVYSVGVLR